MIIDAHLDLAYNVGRGRDVRLPAREQPKAENEIATVGFPDLKEGGIDLVFATIFCQPNTPKHAGYTSPQEAHEQALVQLRQYKEWEQQGWIGIVGRRSVVIDERLETGDWRKKHDSPSLPSPVSRLSSLLLLEGAEAIRTLNDVQLFYDAGVRIVGMSWQKTRYAGGTATPGPLTDLGRELVRAFDEIGILHDTSHLAERSFWDLLHATDKRVIASHSNCRAIVGRDPNERHLTDAMIRAIAERGGVIGINFYDRFLLPFAEFGARRATLDDVVAHAKHICDLTGSADHVGIGTDLDGGLGREQIPLEIETIADLPRIADRLAASGFAPADVAKVMSGNWDRVIQKAGWTV